MKKGTSTLRKCASVAGVMAALLMSATSWATLTPQDKAELSQTYKTIKAKLKGPFTINYCTCVNGKKAPVADKKMRVRGNPCAEVFGSKQLFCSAYRNDLAKRLAKHGLYIANIFSNEVYLWDEHNDHHRLAKGFVLEKHYMETHPQSKLTTSRAYGGISGAEFEVVYAPQFFAKYYALPDWTDFRNYLLQYELQRRFFLRGNMASINEIRNLATSIYRTNKDFKPIKDLIHNRMTAGLIPLIEDFQKKHPKDKQNAARYKKLIASLRKLTEVDKNALKEYLPNITDNNVKTKLQAVLQTSSKSGEELMNRLADLLVAVRNTVAKRAIRPEEAVEMVDLNVSANSVLHATFVRVKAQRKSGTARQSFKLIRDLLGGVYGAGLISHREYEAIVATLDEAMGANTLTVRDVHTLLNRLDRVVEWAQASIRSLYADVWEPWSYLFPDIHSIIDDTIRSSPLMDYAGLVKSLRETMLSKLNLEHDILGEKYAGSARALNPGLAVGRLVFFSDKTDYTRDDILALETTSAELEPVAGIITKDEGNVVSHVQLLARALGVPNAVFLETVYSKLPQVKGKKIFYAITPHGRIIFKEVSKMNETDKQILAEYERNKERTGEAEFKGQSGKLSIDAERLNLKETKVLPLEKVRRKDSGVICGPKAAFLGELKHYFPKNVARGVVIPFGVYYKHFKKAKVAVPAKLKNKGIAKEGSPLRDFVKSTYDEFFNSLLTDSRLSSKQLADWIKPRLEIIRYSIMQISFDPKFTADLRRAIAKQGLFVDDKNEMTKGVFVRSDTNVEDMPNFNGAGLNLTIFNLMSFSDILEGIKKVWASPFTYRSFAWRQSVISDPNLVFPSIVVLEAIPSDKSGVLITADVETGHPSCMTIATAEGVGGTVDGTPAETLLYKSGKTILLAQYKSLYRRMLILTGRGGSHMVPSTGSETVLTDAELKKLVAAAQKITAEFEPERSADGRPLPWDIEYGFVKGHLYLFQTRPFVGNSDIRNLPALAALDKDVIKKEKQSFDMNERVQW